MHSSIATLLFLAACTIIAINANPLVARAPPHAVKINSDLQTKFKFHKNEAAPTGDPSGLGACITTPTNSPYLTNKGQTVSPYDCLLKCAYANEPFSAFGFPPGFSGTPSLNSKVDCFCISIEGAMHINGISDSSCATECVPNGLFGCGQVESNPNVNSTLNAVATDDLYYENFLIFIGAFLGGP
ncbi:hypothetical protein HDU76_005251 [Blyttiomyces sp. JEL0837]|nr:hypothetical protein HDU76_005251 [Blyttiomyces sp. JEL0837]